MKHYFLITAALFFAACSEKPGYEITGTVANADLNGKYVYLYDAPFRGYNVPAMDSTQITEQTFTFKGVADTAKVKTLVLPAEEGKRPEMAEFILENARLSASFGEKCTTVTGSPENDELTAFNKQMADIYSGSAALVDRTAKAIHEKPLEQPERCTSTFTNLLFLGRQRFV